MAGFWRSGQADVRAIRRDLYWLLGLGLLLIGSGLGLRQPWPADEPRFALIARDMVRTGEWLVPMVGGDLYADKPPVFFWLLAGTLKITGSLGIAFLLPSLLAALACVLLVYDLGRRLWNREAGLAAGLLLLLTAQFLWQGRQAQIDMVLCFWTTLGLYGLLRHLLLGPAWGWYVTGCAAAGFGVITKGVGFLPLLLFLPYAYVRHRGWDGMFRGRGGWRWALGPLAFVVAIGLWLVPLLIAAQDDPVLAAYRDEILFRQTVNRYAEAWHHQKPFWYFIVNVIPGLWLPLTALLPWLVPHWRASLRERDARVALVGVWIVLVVLFFSLSAGKRGVYVLPAVPAAVLLAAPWLADMLMRKGPQRAIFGVAMSIVAIIGATALYVLFFDTDLRAQVLDDYGIDPPGPLLVMCVVGCTMCALLWARRALAAYVGVLVTCMLTVGYWVNPALDAARSGAAFMRQVEESATDIPELGLVAYEEQYLLQLRRPTVNFGHARWRDWEQEAFDAAAWLSERPGRALLVDESVRARCFPQADTRAVGRSNRRSWFVVAVRAAPECVGRGHSGAALKYLPPNVRSMPKRLHSGVINQALTVS